MEESGLAIASGGKRYGFFFNPLSPEFSFFEIYDGFELGINGSEKKYTLFFFLLLLKFKNFRNGINKLKYPNFDSVKSNKEF